jgi:hypothetical protein
MTSFYLCRHHAGRGLVSLEPLDVLLHGHLVSLQAPPLLLQRGAARGLLLAAPPLLGQQFVLAVIVFQVGLASGEKFGCVVVNSSGYGYVCVWIITIFSLKEGDLMIICVCLFVTTTSFWRGAGRRNGIFWKL